MTIEPTDERVVNRGFHEATKLRVRGEELAGYGCSAGWELPQEAGYGGRGGPVIMCWRVWSKAGVEEKSSVARGAVSL